MPPSLSPTLGLRKPIELGAPNWRGKGLVDPTADVPPPIRSILRLQQCVVLELSVDNEEVGP